MYTLAELLLLEALITERLGLSADAQADVRGDVMAVYLARLVQGHRLPSVDDARLLATLPEFGGWWRQRWAAQDRQLLANYPAPAIRVLCAQGVELRAWYRKQFDPLTWGYLYPNDAVMEAFSQEKRRQKAAYDALKNLFTNP